MVAPERLAQLNADSAACIARWRIRVEQNEALGRFLVSGTGVPAGETVMVLPPNLIQAFAEVRDYNTVIQVRACGAACHEAAAAEDGLGVLRCATASTCRSGCTAQA